MQRRIVSNLLGGISGIVASITSIIIFTQLLHFRVGFLYPLMLTIAGVTAGIGMSYWILKFSKSKYKLFLAYSFADKEFARKLALDLRDIGYTVFDPNENILVSENIKVRVYEMLIHSNAVLLIASKNMLNSRWVKEELSYALENKKSVYPVVIDECKIPHQIEMIKYVDMRYDYASSLKLLNKSIILTAGEIKGDVIELGIYQTEDGREYDCHFIQDAKIVEAIGPLLDADQVGSRGVAFMVDADSEQEARQNLAKVIGEGHWA